MVELVLQPLERLVGQILLVAQRLLQSLHGLLPGAGLTALLAVLGHLKVLHHLRQLVEQLLRLGHAALFHQLLQAVEHVFQLLTGQFLCVGRQFRHLLTVLLCLLCHLPHVVAHRLAQFLHQLRDLLVGGAVFHRL